MKKIIKFCLVSCFATLLFCSCEDNEEPNLSVPSHRVVTANLTLAEVGGYLTFADFSTGVVSRTWTFPEGAADITTSGEDIVKATFLKAGKYDIQLRQIFKENAYVGRTLKGKELDTTFVVDVIDKVKIALKANIINIDGSLGQALTLSDRAENVIPLNGNIQYSITTEGGPTEQRWTLPGGDFETLFDTPNVNIQYNKAGTYDFQVYASRTNPIGGDTISFKNFIKVVP